MFEKNPPAHCWVSLSTVSHKEWEVSYVKNKTRTSATQLGMGAGPKSNYKRKEKSLHTIGAHMQVSFNKA